MKKFQIVINNASPLNTGFKLNSYKTFRRGTGLLLDILCMFNLRSVDGLKNSNGLKNRSYGKASVIEAFLSNVLG